MFKVMVVFEEFNSSLSRWLQTIKDFDIEFNDKLAIFDDIEIILEYANDYEVLSRVHKKVTTHEEMISKFLQVFALINSSEAEMAYYDIRPIYRQLNVSMKSLIRFQETVITFENGIASINRTYFKTFIDDVKTFLAQIDQIISNATLRKVLSMLVHVHHVRGINWPKDSNEYAAWIRYIVTANCANLDSIEFLALKAKIDSLARALFDNNFFPSAAAPYIAIVGPSFMGKTQTAFNLARDRPVFYANFASNNVDLQHIYKSFVQISYIFKTCLADDIAVFVKKQLEVSTSVLIAERFIKLKTIGLIWHLIVLSQTFDWNGNESWFEFYVKERDLVFEPLSLSMFWAEMGKNYTNFDNTGLLINILYT